MASKTNSEQDSPAFDDQLGELEGIVSELEEGGLGLEPSIERYQRGIELLKECHKTLAGYRKRVEELTRDAESTLEGFDGDPDVEGGGD